MSPATVPLYDAHNHLHDAWLAPHRARVFADLSALPLRAAVVNGTSESDWADVAALCAPGTEGARELRLIPSYGLHPWDVGNAGPSWRDALRGRLDANPQAALGEIGLDRWILDRARADDWRLTGLRRAPLEEQLDAFTWQLALAAERNLAVTVHCLDAWGPLYDALRSTPRPARGFLLHAYGGSADLARRFAELGAYFSFNGHFLADRHAARRAVFASLPLDRLLVETDAPAMRLPATHERFAPFATDQPELANHPANIGASYVALAELRGVPLDSFAVTIEQNFHALFIPARA